MIDPMVVLAYVRSRLSVALGAVQRAFKRIGLALVSALVTAAQFITAHRHERMLLAETAGGCLVLVGVSNWSVPSALILGGLAVIGAVEVRS